MNSSPRFVNTYITSSQNHVGKMRFFCVFLSILLLLIITLMLAILSEPNHANAESDTAVALLSANAPIASTVSTAVPSTTASTAATSTVTATTTATPTITTTPVITATPVGASVPFKLYLPVMRGGNYRTFMPFMYSVRNIVAPTITVQPTPIFITQPTQMPAPVPINTPTIVFTFTPTVNPSATPSPTPTPDPSVVPSPTGSTTMPTPLVDPPLGKKGPCAADELTDLTQVEIVAAVKMNRGCAEPLVDLLIDDPDGYFDAFYDLVPSVEATEDLWFAVDTQMRAGNFRFEGVHVESLWTNLPDAVDACVTRRRCADWETYIIIPLLAGEMYQCPELTELDSAALLESVPYGDYFCTENTATELALLADEATIDGLLTIATQGEFGWSRRNGLRVLGRFAELGADQPAGKLMIETVVDDVKATILEQLLAERNEPALQDLIWLTDSHYFPFFDAQPLFERLVIDSSMGELTTFRAMAGVTRLLATKDGLEQRDLNFVLEQLNATMPFIRSQAARTLTVLEPSHVSDKSKRDQIKAFLTQRLTFEENFMVEVALQEALDLYAGTNDLETLREKFEAEHLAATLTEKPITIRSGLPDEELPQYLTLMQQTESAFFDTLGAPFDTPVEGDSTEAMTLLLFETRPAYQEYMDAFVGFGSQAGGLYIEKDATLYTYQRTPEESSFTIEHLVQHEFTHYLNGRYVFPNLWTDPGFHDQPKGWIDEGTGEYFGLTLFEEDGSFTQPLADARLDTICSNSGTHTSLSELINRRAGYDQPGVFDYDYAWAFMYYLFQQRPPVALKIFDAYRDESYAVEEFVSIAGVPAKTLESAWHSLMDDWCDSRDELQAAGSATMSAAHHTHESHILSHIGGIYTMPLPPVNATGRTNDEEEVIRLITSE